MTHRCPFQTLTFCDSVIKSSQIETLQICRALLSVLEGCFTTESFSARLIKDQSLAGPTLCLALPNSFTTWTHIPGPSQSKPVLLQSVLSLLVSGSQHILQWFSSLVSSTHLLSYLLGCDGSHLDKPEGKQAMLILHLPSLHSSHPTGDSDKEKARGKHCFWHCIFELQQGTIEHALKDIRTIFRLVQFHLAGYKKGKAEYTSFSASPHLQI